MIDARLDSFFNGKWTYILTIRIDGVVVVVKRELFDDFYKAKLEQRKWWGVKQCL